MIVVSESMKVSTGLQNALRHILNDYANGNYLRRRARWGYPVAWGISKFAVNNALMQLAREILPWRNEPEIKPFLSSIEDSLLVIDSDPEMHLCQNLVKGYQVLETLLQRYSDLAEYSLPQAIFFDAHRYRQLDRPYFSPVVNLVKYLASEMGAYINNAWIHGSVADLQVAKGYSDLDVLVVVNRQTTNDPTAIKTLAKKSYQAYPYLYLFDPLQHHGLQLMTAVDWLAYPQSWLPLGAIAESRAVLGAEHSIRVRDSLADAGEAFRRVLESFVLRSRNNWEPASAYEFKFFLSVLMLLPTFYMQAQGQYCTKRESFYFIRESAPGLDWSVIETASNFRQRWPFARFPGIGRFLAPFVQRKILKSHYQPMLKQFSPDLVDDAATLAVSLYKTLVYRVQRPVVFTQSPISVNDEPVARSDADYDIARQHYLQMLQREPAVMGLLEYGSISTPGISDLDFIVILDDSARAPLSAALSIESLPFSDRYLVLHQPVILSVSLLNHLSEWLPYSKIIPLWMQNSISYSGNSTPEPYTVAACLIEKLYKYHRYYQRGWATNRISARWALAVFRALEYSLQSAEFLTGLPISDRASVFVSALLDLRSNWFAPCDSFHRNEQLRYLHEEGKKLLEDLTAQMDDWLFREGWLIEPASENAPRCTARLRSLYAHVPSLRCVLGVSPGASPQTEFEHYLATRGKSLGAQQAFLEQCQLSFGSVLL
jgi:hypothetical protein